MRHPLHLGYAAARRCILQESAAGRWTYSYDAADQVRTLAYDTGITTYAYDLSGNRVSREAPDASRTTYTWDAQDRLTSLEQPGGARLTSTYRHDGLRHSRADATGTQTFLWDGRDVLAVEGVNPRRFARGVDLARNLGDGLGQVFHLDALGTVQALSAADGSEITRYGVDPWGNVQSGSAPGNAYVYHGGLGYWEEPGAGLSYVRARWLEPEKGSWLSVDPVSGEPRYAYAWQMPTRLVDPSGESALDLLDPQLVARITKFLADPLREGPGVLPDLLDTAHSMGLVPFNTQQLQDLLAKTLRKLQGTQTPRWLEKLAPPPLHDAAGWRDYAAGVLKGILVVLGEFLAGAALIVAAFAFPLVGQIGLVLAVVALLIYVCQHGVSLNSLLQLVLQPVQEDLERLRQAEPLAPGDRGYVAAHLLGSGICLVLLTLFSLKGGKVNFADLGRALSKGKFGTAVTAASGRVQAGIAAAVEERAPWLQAGVKGAQRAWEELVQLLAGAAGRVQAWIARITGTLKKALVSRRPRLSAQQVLCQPIVGGALNRIFPRAVRVPGRKPDWLLGQVGPHCGTTSVAMVLQRLGIDPVGLDPTPWLVRDPEGIVISIKFAGIAALLRKQGVRDVVEDLISPSVAEIDRLVIQGRTAIALVDSPSTGHAVVVERVMRRNGGQWVQIADPLDGERWWVPEAEFEAAFSGLVVHVRGGKVP